VSAMKIPADMRPANMSEKPTHAICSRHGVVVPADADDHTCGWIMLVERVAVGR